jgi:hypothetical protein
VSPAAPRREEAAGSWAGELADVRERLARLEVTAEAQETAAGERHREVLAALGEMKERQDVFETRSWKVALGLAALGLGGGAGGVELVRAMVGG